MIEPEERHWTRLDFHKGTKTILRAYSTCTKSVVPAIIGNWGNTKGLEKSQYHFNLQKVKQARPRKLQNSISNKCKL